MIFDFDSQNFLIYGFLEIGYANEYSPWLIFPLKHILLWVSVFYELARSIFIAFIFMICINILKASIMTNLLIHCIIQDIMVQIQYIGFRSKEKEYNQILREGG